MLVFVRTNSDNADFRLLVAELDQDLQHRDGKDHQFYAQFNSVVNIQHVIVAYEADRAVGCGAFKRYDDRTVEVKRMFVKPYQRGKGVAKGILAELENWALESGITQCILETGKRQPEAIALYLSHGYAQIPNYGQYTGVDNSVCMLKQLNG